MAREKKPVHKVQMTERKRKIIRQLLKEYHICLLYTSDAADETHEV